MSVSFDKRLAELDAYLQMLIVENNLLDNKLNALSSSSSSSLQNIAIHDSEREGLSNIRNNLETLISSIKHSIVLLQIAKVSSKGTTSLSEHLNSHRPAASSSSPQPPARPIRSHRHTESPQKLSKERNSSVDQSSSCSYNSQQNTIKKKQSFISSSQSSSSSSAVVVATAAPSEPQTQLIAAPVVVAAAATSDWKQRDSLLQHRAVASSSSSSSSKVAETSENRHHNSKNVLVDLSDTSACGDGGKSAVDFNDSGAKHDDFIVDEDDDDAFFDAATEPSKLSNIQQVTNYNSNDNSNTISKIITNGNDLILSNATSPNMPLQTASQQSSLSNHTNETNNNEDQTIEDGSIDWDAMYEEEEDEEPDSMEGQGSVIKHLLSQIRIGMDLTKVVLPTFILERRSLLEMYADFFAHPDLFSAIPDFETPAERMIQLVKWYLSAFHAGRRSSVAKKPYNPILGEIFRCNWNLTEIENRDKQTIGHAKSATENSELGQQLTFVAEQVSHHPPVSAFYAVNKEKDISCCAHIYTKSKYLGLSVGVHNVGQGVINVSKHNETYICTFPSAYGRSILTVPWVELGGSVDIKCEQTGYKASIEFVTKPFYGGKKHRVMGEITRPNNEPILSIDGEWNGIMYSKSQPSSNKKEVFVDTTSLPVIKKHVKSINAQETYESRNVWKEVTRALKLKDVDSATAAKSYIEQRQRDLLRERQEKGQKWKSRFFEPVDEGWKFSDQHECSLDIDE